MSEPDAQFKVVKVDPDGSGMDWDGHLGKTIYSARRCCKNCTVIFGSLVEGLCHDPTKPESAGNDPTPIGPFVVGELEPINTQAKEMLEEIRAQHPELFKMEIIRKVSKVLRDNLSKEEMISLGDALDGGAGDLLLDSVNEILQEIAPEVFEEAEEKV